MSGIVLPTNNKTPKSNLPQQCSCGHCNNSITQAPYYWKQNNGKRRYYIIAHALKYAYINPEQINGLINRNQNKLMQMRAKRTHHIAPTLRGNRIYN